MTVASGKLFLRGTSLTTTGSFTVLDGAQVRIGNGCACPYVTLVQTGGTLTLAPTSYVKFHQGALKLLGGTVNAQSAPETEGDFELTLSPESTGGLTLIGGTGNVRPSGDLVAGRTILFQSTVNDMGLIVAGTFINHGLIRHVGPRGLHINIPAGGTFENGEGGVLQLQANTTINDSGDGAPQEGPWLTNHGEIEVSGPEGRVHAFGINNGRVILNEGMIKVDSGEYVEVYVGAGGTILNGAEGTVDVDGEIQFNNTGTMTNHGCWRVGPGGRFAIVTNAPTNWDPVGRRWNGGCVVIDRGQWCMPLAATVQVIASNVHCIQEAVVCTGGGSDAPFGGLHTVSDDGEFVADNMSIQIEDDLVVDGSVQFVNGAFVSIPGTLVCNGDVVVNNSTVIPNDVEIGQGTCGGEGFAGGSVSNNGGTVAPGQSPGRFDAPQNYTQGAGGTLQIELGGRVPETGYDVLAVGQTATLGGTLEVQFINGFEPVPGDSFVVVTAANVTGTFTQVDVPANHTLDVIYGPNTVTLVAPAPTDVGHGPEWSPTLSFAVIEPNPIQKQATLRFSAPVDGHARVTVHDLTGRRVATLLDAEITAGVHTVSWDTRNDHGAPVGSAIYLARLEQGDDVAVAKLAVRR